MACRFEYNGKTYDQDSLAKELEKMPPHIAHKYIDGVQNIPDAPFKKSWLELAAKRMIREAAEKGYQRLSWTPGEAQAARYDLSKHISEVHYSGSNLKAYDHNGNTVINTTGVKHEDLSNYIGKEAANKLLSQPVKQGSLRSLVGQDLKVGGEGMHEFYDKMLPRVLEKIGKDYGVKVKDGTIVKPETKLSYEELQSRRAGKKPDSSQFQQPIKYIDLPQGLKDTALHKGFPLFSSGMMISPPIDNKAADKLGLSKPKFKLTKVQGNPFNGK